MSQFDNCPTPQPLTPELLKSNTQDLLYAMGAKSCDTSKSNFQFENDLSVGAGFIANMNTKAQSTFVKTLGCEQIAVNAQKFYNLKQNINCLLTESKNDTRQTIVGNNNIKFVNNGVVDCGTGGFKINQDITLKTVAQNSLNDDTKQKIVSTLNDIVTSTITNAMKSDTGFMGANNGNKLVNELESVTNNSQYNSNMMSRVNMILQDILAKNNITLENNGIIKGGQCILNQGVFVDIAAANMLAASFDQFTQTDTFKQVAAVWENSLESRAEGQPNFFSSNWKSIILMIVVLIVVVYIAKTFLSSDKKTTSGENVGDLGKTLSDSKGQIFSQLVKNKFRYRYKY